MYADHIGSIDAREAPDSSVRSVAHGADLSYEALKARFELRHFKTENDKLPFHSINVRTGEITSRTKDAFKVAYMDWIPVGGKQFLDRWFNDGLKRAYERIEYSYVKKEDRERTVFYAFPDPSRPRRPKKSKRTSSTSSTMCCCW